ncbi:helix-turn-helix domain-containing protein [Coleofasciculus sp. LEGE 07092]|nr:helix-turn-helix domain-containing protein [Coleofasciculus sp. LEGE 07081]MBE9148679.1 helix-turn-helix domain-containing protein [Coleofasciculus sp. LEGE 07092]
MIDLYSHCQLAMTPRQFHRKWDVNYETIAYICSRSTSTVQCWFRRGRDYRRPHPIDLRHLALMDFLLEHFEEIPETLTSVLCTPE